MERGLGAWMIAGPGRLRMKRVGGVSGRGLSFCNRCPKKVDFSLFNYSHIPKLSHWQIAKSNRQLTQTCAGETDSLFTCRNLAASEQPMLHSWHLIIARRPACRPGELNKALQKLPKNTITAYNAFDTS